VFVRSVDERVAKELDVVIVGEDCLPIVAALDDVLRLAGDDDARKAGHDLRCRRQFEDCEFGGYSFWAPTTTVWRFLTVLRISR
jgi:hypothetical protein